MVKRHAGFSLIEIMLVIVGAAVLIGLGVFAFGNAKKDSGQSSQDKSNKNEVVLNNSSDSKDPFSAETVAIEKNYDLAKVCEGTQQPNNLTFSSDDTKIVAAFEEKIRADGYYDGTFQQATFVTDKEFRRHFSDDDETKTDIVACLDATENKINEIVCDFEGTKVTMLRYEFSMRAYDMKSKTTIADAITIPPEEECPKVTLVNNGQFRADVSSDAVNAEFKNLQ